MSQGTLRTDNESRACTLTLMDYFLSTDRLFHHDPGRIRASLCLHTLINSAVLQKYAFVNPTHCSDGKIPIMYLNGEGPAAVSQDWGQGPDQGPPGRAELELKAKPMTLDLRKWGRVQRVFCFFPSLFRWCLDGIQSTVLPPCPEDSLHPSPPNWNRMKPHPCSRCQMHHLSGRDCTPADGQYQLPSGKGVRFHFPTTPNLPVMSEAQGGSCGSCPLSRD